MNTRTDSMPIVPMVGLARSLLHNSFSKVCLKILVSPNSTDSAPENLYNCHILLIIVSRESRWKFPITRDWVLEMIVVFDPQEVLEYNYHHANWVGYFDTLHKCEGVH